MGGMDGAWKPIRNVTFLQGLMLVIALFSFSGQLAIFYFLLYPLFYFFQYFYIFGMDSRKSAKTPGKQSFFAHQEKSSILWSRQNSLPFPFRNYNLFTFHLAQNTFSFLPFHFSIFHLKKCNHYQSACWYSTAPLRPWWEPRVAANKGGMLNDGSHT